MPTVFRVDFAGIDPRHVRASGIHHLMSSWLCETPQEHVRTKPYAVGPRVDHDHGVSVTVRCLSDHAAALVAAMPAGTSVQFGTTHPREAFIARAPERVADVTWGDLADYRGTTRWRIEFLSPVCLRSGQIDQPWPEPYTILRGLEDRWALWGPPPEAPFTEAVSRRLHVTKADLRTVTTRLPPHPATAAEGTVEWTCSDPDAATTVERLLRFAEYAGVGSRTEHGLGVVRVSGQVTKP